MKGRNGGLRIRRTALAIDLRGNDTMQVDRESCRFRFGLKGSAELFAVALVTVVAIWLTCGIVIFGRRKPGYDQVRHTISELGERGARDARIVAFGLFLPAGIGLAAVAILSDERSPESAALAAAVAIGYLGAVVFPCDPGSPMQGSFSQAMHNLAGGIQYIGGALALASLGECEPIYSTPAVIVGIVAVILTVPQTVRIRGAAQRVGELVLFASLAAALW